MLNCAFLLTACISFQRQMFILIPYYVKGFQNEYKKSDMNLKDVRHSHNTYLRGKANSSE